ncbi:hypothetical protein BCR35DRAFT_333223 [Leucosporidium creatinivorum]|uniref:F-box domain-containing protein n=1 Tax=Leucosporidium creatinivorum TaxID=106004 RepID=A0A1Y2ETY0_9BASI|nr:hypothetical protein BCR35DRAFT_333223 [Leucosporidium creatinivorum]
MDDSKSASPQTVLSDMARAKGEEQRDQLKEGGAGASGWTTNEQDGTTKVKLRGFSLWKDAPVEVFLEILSYSTPHDLLLFSLVNKPLYSLLATSPADPEAEGKRFWKQARQNVCMPDLRAGDLSERELAGLVEGRGCIVCRDKSEHHMVDYYIRMRLCEDCRETELDHEVDIEDRVGELHPSALACTLFTLDDPRYCDMDDTRYFYKPALREMNDKLVALQLAADKAEGPSTDDPNDPRTVLTRFIRERTELVEKASLDGRDLFQWEEEDHERRYYEEQQRRAQRVRLIKAHLLDLGFDERDCSFEREENEEFLRRSEPLSTVALSQALPSLLAEIQLNSQRRLELESFDRLRQRSELLRPLYHEMLASRPTKLEKAVFPHFVLTATFSSIFIPSPAQPN